MTHMNDEMWMDEARQIAAQCWCDEETKHIVMDDVLAEAVARRIAVWMETAAMFSRGQEFYRDLLDQCAANLGLLADMAYIQDDGGISDEPLRLKIPELVAELSEMAMGEG